MGRFIHLTVGYRTNSAGVMVIHRFCHLMRKAGFNSFVTCETNPEWDCPIWDGKPKDDDIMIYPDIIRNHPFGRGKVVRYMLYYPITGYFGNAAVTKDELILCYNQEYFEQCKKIAPYEYDDSFILNIPIIDSSLFNTENCIKDIKDCYYIGKGGGNWNEFDKKYGLEKMQQLRGDFPNTRKGTADFIKKVKRFYSFDRCTALLDEALMCGCEVFIIDDKGEAIPYFNKNLQLLKKEFTDLEKIYKFVDKVCRFWNLKRSDYGA